MTTTFDLHKDENHFRDRGSDSNIRPSTREPPGENKEPVSTPLQFSDGDDYVTSLLTNLPSSGQVKR